MNVYESHEEKIMSVNISVKKNDLSSELTCILLGKSSERREQPPRENDPWFLWKINILAGKELLGISLTVVVTIFSLRCSLATLIFTVASLSLYSIFSSPWVRLRLLLIPCAGYLNKTWYETGCWQWCRSTSRKPPLDQEHITPIGKTKTATMLDNFKEGLILQI